MRAKPMVYFGLLCIGLLWGGCGVDLEKVDAAGQHVVFWHQHELQRSQVLTELVEEFNRTNSHGIEVRAEYAGEYRDIYNRMLGAIGGKEALPQLVVAYLNQAQVYYREAAVVDLKPYMESPRWGLSAAAKADYVQAFPNSRPDAEEQLVFRPSFSTELLYYNTDWLLELGYKAPPNTWERFAEMCRRAKEQPFSRNADLHNSLGFLLQQDASRLASMVFSRGGDLMNAWRLAYTFNTEPMVETLEMLRALKREGAMELFDDPYLDRREFSAGRLLFLMGSSSRLLAVRSDVEAGLDFSWNVKLIPQKGFAQVNNIFGASLAVGRSTPQQQLAAWLFIKWFTEPHQQNRWVHGSNYFPVRLSTAPELESYFRTAFELLQKGWSEPAVEGYETVRELMVRAMVSVLGGANAGQVLANLEAEANQTLRQ